jgi:UDP-glucose 4-epimerase
MLPPALPPHALRAPLPRSPRPPVSAPPPDGPFGRVLVTGCAGFIGSHLVAALLARGAEVVVVDDFSTGEASNLPSHPALRVVRACVSERGAMERAGPVDLVFHLAGVVGMRLVASDRRRAYALAVRGTAAVLAATGDAPVVLASSSSVYGLQDGGRAREDARTGRDALLAYDGGRRGYASGKWALERLGRRAGRAGRRVLIVRPFNVVGPRQSAAYGMVVPTFVSSALEGRPLTVFAPGTQTRCFTCVDAFVACLLRLVRTPAAWALPGAAINVGSDSPTSIARLARIVLEETGSASEVEVVPYGSRFPGAHDVQRRLPHLARLERMVGGWEWPDVRAVVRRCIAAAEADRA